MCSYRRPPGRAPLVIPASPLVIPASVSDAFTASIGPPGRRVQGRAELCPAGNKPFTAPGCHHGPGPPTTRGAPMPDRYAAYPSLELERPADAALRGVIAARGR